MLGLHFGDGVLDQALEGRFVKCGAGDSQFVVRCLWGNMFGGSRQGRKVYLLDWRTGVPR